MAGSIKPSMAIAIVLLCLALSFPCLALAKWNSPPEHHWPSPPPEHHHWPPSPPPPYSSLWVFRCSATAAPGVKSNGRAGLWLGYDEDKSQFYGKLIIERLNEFTMAHLHLNTSSFNGTIAMWIMPSDMSGPLHQPISGNWSTRFTVEADMINGVNDLDLLQLLLGGNVYLNVHTTRWPSGELQAVPQFFSGPPPMKRRHLKNIP